MSETRSVQLGGGLNSNIVAGRVAGMIEKRHLVFKRLFVERAARQDRAFIDLGTDYSYPFYDTFEPTILALTAIQDTVHSARNYPSSYGTTEIRLEFAAFMKRQFAVELDPSRECMVSTGASQVFDALSRTYAGQFVLVPDLALSTVTSIATGNGATVLRMPSDEACQPDLTALPRLLSEIGPNAVRFLYINSPCNPTGRVLSHIYLTELVAIARAFGVLVLHDHDSWFTLHRGARSTNILEIPGAAEAAISVLSVSKELGLPGIRVGMVAGNPGVVNDLRIHNSEFCVMIPEFCQAAVAAALRASTGDEIRRDVQTRIGDALRTALTGWRRLGWPDEAMLPPSAGYKFLLRPPERFGAMGGDEVAGVELFDFLVARDAAAKLSTSRSFNAARADWVRMIIMQEAGVLDEFFQRLDAIGVHYHMRPPDGLREEFLSMISECDLWDL